MTEIKFYVQGSAPIPYQVTFMYTNNNITAFCTCPAGENGLHCKHRLSILGGDTSGITSGNVDKVKVVQSWLPGSSLEGALIQLREAEQEFGLAKKRVSSAKRVLARAMRV